ncbi:hypothetical protein HF325_006242 [Metschnikowia pulcherrima]|uniref:J domain-containing protein n=1 Tax=Metschnikowia pulcherrima TaxID=27326 RepID=A0A8H7GN51_9ASCO|nr:hypothetical protein HF325_006242 [Metschnikowia pulcherrima]
MTDLDAHLQAQEAEIARDQEIARVLACHPKDYFAILQINPLSQHASLATVLRKIYRKKSLQIHPDKVKNKDAPAAFDLLKKANLVLASEPIEDSGRVRGNDEDDKSIVEDKKKYMEKSNLILIYEQVAEGLGGDNVDDFYHESNRAIREKVAVVLKQHEMDQTVETNYLQRQEMRKQSDFKSAAKEREMKKSWESRWELDRDTRVKLWRNFSTKVEKPKKKKKVLA